jgi:hypothetical protein
MLDGRGFPPFPANSCPSLPFSVKFQYGIQYAFFAALSFQSNTIVLPQFTHSAEKPGTVIWALLSPSIVCFPAMKQKPLHQCRLCLREKKLIKAHIIPEGFFRALRSGNQAPEMHTDSPGQHPKRMQVGIYDSSILCGDCDQKLAPWDAYAQELLLHRFSEATVLQENQEKVGWRIKSFDYRRLKLFFISLLWRASVSKHPFYKRISVGPFENRLRSMILNEEPGDAQDFAVLLGRFDESWLTAMLDPHPSKFEGVSFVRFYLTGFVAFIKADQRPAPGLLVNFCMQENAPLIVIVRSLHNSKDGLVMKKLATSAMDKKTMKSGKATG